MRIWSLHPEYLDAKGLVALWRETLLAKHVLEGKTKGYRNHPQLDRFKKLDKPVQAVNQYLAAVLAEARARGYSFDEKKIDPRFSPVKIPVTRGQVKYETEHLLSKLRTRDPEKFRMLKKNKRFRTHPIFRVVPGGVEEWEII